MFIVTLAEVPMVTASGLCGVALAPATYTVSSALALGAILSLTGSSQGLLVFTANGALTGLTDIAWTAAANTTSDVSLAIAV